MMWMLISGGICFSAMSASLFLSGDGRIVALLYAIIMLQIFIDEKRKP